MNPDDFETAAGEGASLAASTPSSSTASSFTDVSATSSAVDGASSAASTNLGRRLTNSAAESTVSTASSTLGLSKVSVAADGSPSAASTPVSSADEKGMFINSEKYLNQRDFYVAYDYHQPETPSVGERLRRKCCQFSTSCLWKHFRRRVPALAWLPVYNIRQDLLSDVFSGITLAIVQIPQAMAFTMLSGASPVLGLYTSFFSAAVYFLLGTSRYSSLGMAGQVALVVGSAITTRTHLLYPPTSASPNGTSATIEDIRRVEQEVVTTMAFLVGLIQMALGALNAGGLSLFFSEVMMRGCTMAAVAQMIVGQLPSFFGLSVPRYTGPLSYVYIFVDLCKQLPLSNVATLLTSFLSVGFLLAINEGVNRKYRSRMKMPVPTEIILIAISICVSYWVNMEALWGVKVLGSIPTGLPTPRAPSLSLIPEVLVDSLVVVVITFTIIMSQAKVLGSKYECQPDISQELLANGAANVLGAFFSCLPCTFAFVRCVLLIQLKTKTLLSSLVCAFTLLLFLLFVAPAFQPLPLSVLAAILIVALSEVLSDFKLVWTTWRSVRSDSALVLLSFLCVFLLDLQYGIACGVGLSMLAVLFNVFRSRSRLLAPNAPHGLYLPSPHFRRGQEVAGVKVLALNGPLFFGNKDALKRTVDALVRDSLNRNDAVSQPETETGSTSPVKLISKRKLSKALELEVEFVTSPLTAIVLDFTSVQFMDTAAVRMLSMLIDELDKSQISLYIASPSDKVFRMLEHTELYPKIRENIYPSIQNAVNWIESNNRLKIIDKSSFVLDKIAFQNHP